MAQVDPVDLMDSGGLLMDSGDSDEVSGVTWTPDGVHRMRGSV